MTNDYYSVLKKLFPVRDCTGELDHDLSIEGKYMDQVDSTAQMLNREFFPDTATYLLSDYEHVFDTTAATLSSRRAAVVAAERVLVNKSGRLNADYYVSLANGLGYDSTIYEASDMFIVAATTPPATTLPGAVYEATALWTWQLDSTGSLDPNDQQTLRNLINETAPAYTKVIYNFA